MLNGPATGHYIMKKTGKSSLKQMVGCKQMISRPVSLFFLRKVNLLSREKVYI